jgi:hypothetical protein
MEKKYLYIIIIVIAIIGVGAGFGIYYIIQGLYVPPAPEPKILTIYGSGVTGNYSMSMSELKSSKYSQITEQPFYTRLSNGSIVLSGNYSGVSLRSILEEESLLELGAVNYTGIGADEYNPGVTFGMLNISNVMNNAYNLCIIAYGGTSFDPLDVGPLRLMINQSIVAPTIPSIRASRYCVSNLTAIFIA